MAKKRRGNQKQEYKKSFFVIHFPERSEFERKKERREEKSSGQARREKFSSVSFEHIRKRKDIRGNQSEKKRGGKVKKVSIPNEANAVVRSFSCPISLSEDEKKAVVDRGRDATKRAQMVYGKIKKKKGSSRCAPLCP